MPLKSIWKKRLFYHLLTLSIMGMPMLARAVGLEECWRAALQKSEALRSQAEQVVQAQEHITQAQSNFYPAISGSAIEQRQDVSGLTAAQKVSSPEKQTTVKLTASQSIFRGGRDLYLQSQNKKLLLAEDLNLKRSQVLLRNDLGQVFYQILSLEQELRTTDSEIALYQKRIKELQGRVAIGRSRKVEVFSVQYSLSALQAGREQLTTQVRNARDTFSTLTGLPIETQLEDASPLPEKLDLMDQYVARVLKRPDIVSAQAKLEASADAITAARAGHFPSLDLIGNYYLDRPPGSQKEINWDAQLALSIPLFSGDAIQSKLREAVSIKAQQEWLLKKTLEDAHKEVRTLYQTVQSDLKQLQDLLQARDLAEKNYQLEERDYRSGLVNNLEVLTALANWQQARLSYDRTFFNAKSDFFRLQNAVEEGI